MQNTKRKQTCINSVFHFSFLNPDSTVQTIIHDLMSLFMNCMNVTLTGYLNLFESFFILSVNHLSLNLTDLRKCSSKLSKLRDDHLKHAQNCTRDVNVATLGHVSMFPGCDLTCDGSISFVRALILRGSIYRPLLSVTSFITKPKSCALETTYVIKFRLRTT